MNVDVLIYISKLKEFFKKDEEAKNDIFGTIQLDEDKFYGMVEEKSNYTNTKKCCCLWYKKNL